MENKQMKVPQPDDIYTNQSFPVVYQKQRSTQNMLSMKQESPTKRKKSVTFICEDETVNNKDHQQTLKDLNIESFMDRWEANCQKFIFNELIPEAVQGLKQALWKCNGILSLHFKKTLIEYQLFQNDEKNDMKINMQELIGYQQGLSCRGGVIWKCYSTDNPKDVEIINQELNMYVCHLLSFDHLFMIDGFVKSQIYSYVIQRLITLNQNGQNFEYGINQNPKYPSDSQNQNTKVKSFLKEKTQIIRKGEILFEQISDNNEPYFIVHYNNEIWYPKTGKDSIVGAIVLFFYGLKYRLQDYEKREFKSEINRKIDQIVPKNKF